VSDNNVVKLAQPGAVTDSLTEVLRSGARALLIQAVEAEVAEFLAKHAGLKTETGHQRVVRHGHLPEREIMTGVCPVAVRQPRVRDRAFGDGERIRYSPAIVPRYARRSKSLEVLIPILYLKGISTGDFEEVLAALVGKDAPGLSASTIARLKEVWTEEHAGWQKRDLSAKQLRDRDHPPRHLEGFEMLVDQRQELARRHHHRAQQDSSAQRTFNDLPARLVASLMCSNRSSEDTRIVGMTHRLSDWRLGIVAMRCVESRRACPTRGPADTVISRKSF